MNPIDRFFEGEMLDESVWLEIGEFCAYLRVDRPWVIDLVDAGVLEPRGPSPDAWSFPASDAVGEVLAKLEESGLADNTLVIFFSDNGAAEYIDVDRRRNAPLTGHKRDLYEGGTRIPFMVRWPAQVKAGSRSDYAGLNFDLFPTFLELAGAKPAAGLDAISLVAVLQGGTIPTPRDLYFVRREGGTLYGGKTYEAIIRDAWKLMQNDPFSPLELYNLKTDPQEHTNLAATNREFGPLYSRCGSGLVRSESLAGRPSDMVRRLRGARPRDASAVRRRANVQDWWRCVVAGAAQTRSGQGS